jgi:flagellar hook-length control protein FliK
MQAAVKFFDLPFQGAGGQDTNKIGIKLPQRTTDQLSGDENGFMEIMAALTRIPPQELESSLAQLDWVQVEDSAGEFAPLIDLTDQAGANSSILQMLLPQDGTDVKPPPLPLQTPVGQTELPPELSIDAGKNSTPLEMLKPSADTAAQLPLAPTDARHQQVRDSALRAVPTQVMPPDGALKSAADPEGDVPVSKGARLALADRAAETARQAMAQLEGKSDTASLPSDLQPQDSKTLKQWLGDKASIQDKQISQSTLGRHAVSDSPNSGVQPLQAAGAEPSNLQEQVRQRHPFISNAADRQTAQAQKVPAENMAVAQEAGLQLAEKAARQPLHQTVRGADASTIREEAFAVKPSEGMEMQLSSNTSREGAPSFDSQASTTAPKTIAASSTANETPPFIDKDTQIDVVRQIVQRMTLRSDSRQSQMVIRLKPDFLGNVRLQVTTEGQQVMVRMDAESAMVKEVVEQNMLHLKAELSQHGLEIEKFDVFVGNDNDGWRSGQQQAAFRQASKRGGKPSDSPPADDDDLQQSDDSRNQGAGAAPTAASEVDYFA